MASVLQHTRPWVLAISPYTGVQTFAERILAAPQREVARPRRFSEVRETQFRHVLLAGPGVRPRICIKTRDGRSSHPLVTLVSIAPHLFVVVTPTDVILVDESANATLALSCKHHLVGTPQLVRVSIKRVPPRGSRLALDIGKHCLEDAMPVENKTRVASGSGESAAASRPEVLAAVFKQYAIPFGASCHSWVLTDTPANKMWHVVGITDGRREIATRAEVRASLLRAATCVDALPASF